MFFSKTASRLINGALLNNMFRINLNSNVLTLEEVKQHQYEWIIYLQTFNPERTFTLVDIQNSAAQAIILFFIAADPTLGTIEKIDPTPFS